jgi:DNA-binding response OmpR family regulator
MKTRKILIVDDDIFCRGAMEKLLQSYNYETFSCALAEEAIARLKQESFNILITDLHMPGMDGFELIRNARMIHPELLTIMVTGFSTDEVKSRAKEEGVDGFFCKPIDWEELYSLLDNLSGSDEVRNQDMSLNNRKGKGTFLSGRFLIALILFTLTIFSVQSSKAQPPFYPQNKPTLRSDSQETCWQSSDLALSEAQKKELENLHRAYSAEAMPLRRDLMGLRFELRHLARDTNVQSKVLFDRQKKISELQAKLDNLLLSYQIKARSIFTKEQLEQLPEDCLLGIELGFGMDIGIGRGPRRGPRW